MQLRSGWLWMGVVLCLLLGQGSARALSMSLADVALGDSFVSGNGQLEFSNFSFDSCGCVDAEDITLEILYDGIRLSGPVSTSGFKSKSFEVGYTVTGIHAPIVSASLELDSDVNAQKFGKVFATKELQVKGQKPHPDFPWLSFFWNQHPWQDDKAFLHSDHPLPSILEMDSHGQFDWSDALEWLFEQKFQDWEFGGRQEWIRLARLETFDKEFFCFRQYDHSCGLVKSSDSIEFTPEDQLRVTDAVTIFTLGHDDEATWISSTNRYAVVPEPATGTLLLLGIAGLGAAGRRGRRNPSG